VGSNQKIVQNNIRKRIKIGAYILIPFILVGGLSIAYQLTTGGFESMDFSIGKLWSWASNDREIKQSEDNAFERIIEPVRNRSDVAEAKVVRERETVQVKPVNNPVRIHKPKTGLAQFMANREPFKTVHVDMIQPDKTFNYLRSGKYIDLKQKEFLIPTDIKTRRSRIAVGASFTPGLSYRRLTYNDISSVARIYNQTAYTFGQSKEYRNNNDQAIMNFYSGFDVYANVSKKWTVQMGFYYSSHGEKLTVVNKNDPNEITSNPSHGSAFLSKQSVFESPEMVDYTANEEIPFTNYYGLMEIPVLASYQCVDISDMLHVSVQMGGSYGYLDHAPSSDFELLNKHFISGIVGAEISQYISHEIEIFANPQFKYSFTPTFKKAYEIKQNQWATGLRLGMKVHL